MLKRVETRNASTHTSKLFQISIEDFQCIYIYISWIQCDWTYKYQLDISTTNWYIIQLFISWIYFWFLIFSLQDVVAKGEHWHRQGLGGDCLVFNIGHQYDDVWWYYNYNIHTIHVWWYYNIHTIDSIDIIYAIVSIWISSRNMFFFHLKYSMST